ncbi:MAG TPA: glycosyltransferase family 1 protein [Candidatus Dormibacteraeota bacterium]|nr:glycosyltransferase family 1 protein [Candidatus Dormibacteraeota bacterium]
MNSLAATAGGGLTYIRNVVPHLAAHSGVRVTAALSPELAPEFRGFPNVELLELGIPTARRFWYEQRLLPGLIRHSGADVLLSAGNFALRRSPVPQILLSRNSIYTSPDFFRDLRARREYRMWLETRLRSILAKRSVSWADVTVAPSAAFAEELKRWTGLPVLAVHHGFDGEAFTRDSCPLTQEVEARLSGAAGCFRLLFVSHYNYYRNFETLLRALPILRSRVAGRPVKLLLTCNLAAGKNPGAYRPDTAANLVKTLGVSDMIVELGAVAYRQLHQVYARADAYVSPAYTETFAHPLVEAMASGVPVIASDIAVHREICGNAAVYFERFSPEALAECVIKIAERPETRAPMVARGLERSGDFSWKAHVERILELSQALVHSEGGLAKTSQ